MRRRLVLIGACFALAGCGGGGNGNSADETTTTTAAPAEQTVTISEAEFSLTPNRVHIAQAGTVDFKVRNVGQIAHALEIEGNGAKGETDAIQPGASATLTIKLSKAGTYEMYCPIDGHRGKGMEGTIVAGGSSGAGGMTTEGTTTEDETTTEGTTTDDKGGSGY